MYPVNVLSGNSIGTDAYHAEIKKNVIFDIFTYMYFVNPIYTSGLL